MYITSPHVLCMSRNFGSCKGEDNGVSRLDTIRTQLNIDKFVRNKFLEHVKKSTELCFLLCKTYVPKST